MPEKRIRVWVQRLTDRPNLALQWIDPDDGRRKSKSAETSDPDEAETRRADHEAALNSGSYEKPARMSWERFRELYTEECATGLRERSREKYDTVMDVFEEVCQPTSMATITERTFSTFVKRLRERPVGKTKVGLEPITIKNYLIALNSILTWGVSQKILPRVPGMPRIKVPKKKPQPIPPADFDKLLDVTSTPEWKAYLLCGWWAGLRLSEARQLRRQQTQAWPWLDLAGNRIVLPAGFVKAGVDQAVPLHPTLRAAIEALPVQGDLVFPLRSSRSGKPMSRNCISCHVIWLAKKAGVKLSMHRLRKGFGCRVAKQLGKGGAAMLHELMRHSSMQVTMDFYANVDDALQDAINGLK